MRTKLVQSLSQGLIVLAVLSPANIAYGVTQSALVEQGTEDVGSVTSGEATRANADVQIRRVKQLLFTKKKSEREQDHAFRRLQKLQNELRGQK